MISEPLRAGKAIIEYVIQKNNPPVVYIIDTFHIIC